MITALLWFHKITLDTTLREIGWTYVVLTLLIFTAIFFLVKLLKDL